jgi:hypothetical protein
MVTVREKEREMKYLEELEQKVLRLIQRNQELQAKVDTTAKEVALLKEQIRQYEASLMNQTSASQALAQEKAAIVNSIEELLSSINALENTH